MSAVIDDLMKLPKEDREQHAIDLLRTLTTDDGTVIADYRSKYGLRPMEARMLNYLVIRAGNVCTRSQIEAAIYPVDHDHDSNTISVMMVNVRRKIAPEKIENVWGSGYRISREAAARIKPQETTPLDINPTTGPRVLDEYVYNPATGKRIGLPRKWTPEEDTDLVRMFNKNTSIADMAFECDRSERAVLDRIRALNLRKAA